MARHNELGKFGEQVAREFLIANGYAIVESDNRTGHFEVDIIAMKGSRIVFVEVKTRRADSTDPLDAITPQKIRRICAAANSYVQCYNIPHEAQFDVITVLFNADGSHTLEHYPDAFRPPLRTWR